MRPASITLFDRLFLGAIVIGILNTALSFESVMAQLKADPAVAELGMATPGFLIGSAALGYAISLLLWFFISRKASNIAKWILTVLTVIGALMIPFSIATTPLVESLIVVTINALQLVAIWCLFRPDAKAWFAHGPKGMDPAAFE